MENLWTLIHLWHGERDLKQNWPFKEPSNFSNAICKHLKFKYILFYDLKNKFVFSISRLMPESALSAPKEKRLSGRQWFESGRASSVVRFSVLIYVKKENGLNGINRFIKRIMLLFLAERCSTNGRWIWRRRWRFWFWWWGWLWRLFLSFWLVFTFDQFYNS